MLDFEFTENIKKSPKAVVMNALTITWEAMVAMTERLSLEVGYMPISKYTMMVEQFHLSRAGTDGLRIVLMRYEGRWKYEGSMVHRLWLGMIRRRRPVTSAIPDKSDQKPDFRSQGFVWSLVSHELANDMRESYHCEKF